MASEPKTGAKILFRMLTTKKEAIQAAKERVSDYDIENLKKLIMRNFTDDTINLF